MKFVKSVHAAAALTGIVAPKHLNTKSISRCLRLLDTESRRADDSTGSVRNVAATIAHDAMAYYTGNTSAPNSVVCIAERNLMPQLVLMSC